jgi:hypothetical protein
MKIKKKPIKDEITKKNKNKNKIKILYKVVHFQKNNN